MALSPDLFEELALVGRWGLSKTWPPSGRFEPKSPIDRLKHQVDAANFRSSPSAPHLLLLRLLLLLHDSFEHRFFGSCRIWFRFRAGAKKVGTGENSISHDLPVQLRFQFKKIGKKWTGVTKERSDRRFDQTFGTSLPKSSSALLLLTSSSSTSLSFQEMLKSCKKLSRSALNFASVRRISQKHFVLRRFPLKKRNHCFLVFSVQASVRLQSRKTKSILRFKRTRVSVSRGTCRRWPSWLVRNFERTILWSFFRYQ